MTVHSPDHITYLTSQPPVMLFPTILITGILIAYLIGSIPFGLILARIYKIGDLRQIGSGNIGATNMLRAGGRNLAIATLVLDMAKGYIAVMLCGSMAVHILASKLPAETAIKIDANQFLYMFGLYAVIGHVWPVWLKGKGGKGVATALGVLLAFNPIVGLLAMSCWAAIFALTFYSSLAALISITISPFLCFHFIGRGACIASVLIAAIVLFRHRENISRLLNGTESKSNLKKKA